MDHRNSEEFSKTGTFSPPETHAEEYVSMRVVLKGDSLMYAHTYFTTFLNTRVRLHAETSILKIALELIKRGQGSS